MPEELEQPLFSPTLTLWPPLVYSRGRIRAVGISHQKPRAGHACCPRLGVRGQSLSTMTPILTRTCRHRQVQAKMPRRRRASVSRPPNYRFALHADLSALGFRHNVPQPVHRITNVHFGRREQRECFRSCNSGTKPTKRRMFNHEPCLPRS